MTEVRIHDRVMVPVAKIRANTYNANVQTPATFNALVDEIRETGFVGEVQLRPLAEDEREGEYEYELVGGEHRWKVAQILEMPEIPATIHPEWEIDLAKAKSVALNVLSGHIDPVKFTRLFNDLSEKYSADVVRQMMAFADDAEFKRAYRAVKRQLPADMRPKFDKAAKEAATMDDLSVILHELFRKHGSTVDRSYMFFRYGGKMHLTIEMTEKTRKLIDRVTDASATREVDVNEVLGEVLTRGLGE